MCLLTQAVALNSFVFFQVCWVWLRSTTTIKSLTTAQWWWEPPSGTQGKWRLWQAVICSLFLPGCWENSARTIAQCPVLSRQREVSSATFTASSTVHLLEAILTSVVFASSERVRFGADSPGWEGFPLAAQWRPHGCGETLGWHPQICSWRRQTWDHDQGRKTNCDLTACALVPWIHLSITSLT